MSESQIIENFDFEDQMMNGENIYLEKKKGILIQSSTSWMSEDYFFFLFDWVGQKVEGSD